MHVGPTGSGRHLAHSLSEFPRKSRVVAERQSPMEGPLSARGLPATWGRSASYHLRIRRAATLSKSTLMWGKVVASLIPFVVLAKKRRMTPSVGKLFARRRYALKCPEPRWTCSNEPSASRRANVTMPKPQSASSTRSPARSRLELCSSTRMPWGDWKAR